MSYTGLGQSASKEVIPCSGQLYGKNASGYKGTFCCPPDSWENRLYANIKGERSLRYHNEKRVRHALSLLLNGGLDDYAWARNLPIRDGFASLLKLSADNFNKLYPASRWKNVDKIPHPCAADGLYSVWEDNPKPTVEQAKVINMVPGGGAYSPVDTMPDIDQLLVVEKVVVGRGQTKSQVAPGGWLQQFIDTFGLKAMKLPVFVPPTKESTLPFKVPQGVSIPSEGSIQPKHVAIGVAAVALGTGLWWIWRKR